jgi:beta-phosphoglucomutase-like phosphatase (HAD superfamily)
VTTTERPDLGAGHPARPLLSALLCDADGCLFPSEDPAYVASAEVTNALLDELGVGRRYSPVELRRDHTGRNFRATAPLLAAENGVELPEAVLERWVAIEADAVTRHLALELRPDPEVGEPLRLLAAAYPLAVVSSSAAGRVDACLRATDLAHLVAPGRLFSAEDSLPVPVSKPDPAIYALAGERMGVTGPQALAIEDSEVGVRSAVAAGFPVVGLLHFVPDDLVSEQAALLRAAGADAVARTWHDLAADLLGGWKPQVATLSDAAARAARRG